jgi:YHS domain-containing protein
VAEKTAMKKLVVILSIAVGLVACGSSNKAPATPDHQGEHHHEGAPATANKDVKKPGEAKPGDKSTCTVTGEEIDVTADSPHSEHNGKTYYFCCTGCKKKFDADPSKYTKS